MDKKEEIVKILSSEYSVTDYENIDIQDIDISILWPMSVYI